MSTTSQSIGPCNPNIPTKILFGIALSLFLWSFRTKAVTVLRFTLVCLLGVTQLFCSVATKSASQSLQVSLGHPPHHASSLQNPEKTSPSSVKGNHINIKKTEGLIRTDIWYYRICKSIYELCDIWHRNQEAISILWEEIINPTNALPVCA